jgi:hypothetical protein
MILSQKHAGSSEPQQKDKQAEGETDAPKFLRFRVRGQQVNNQSQDADE